MTYPPQTYPVPAFNHQWPVDDSQNVHIEPDRSGRVEISMPESSSIPSTNLTSASTSDSRRPSMVKIEDDFSTVNAHGWHEPPQGPLLAGPVRQYPHPPVSQLNTNIRPHEFNFAAAYTPVTSWPLSAHSDSTISTPIYTPIHDGFGHPPHFPIGGPITFGGFPIDPHTGATMSPQSSQGEWSRASSDGTERPMPLSSPLGRCLSPMSVMRPDGIRKKNARFEIPKDRNLNNIDELIQRSTNESEKKELKQQKRLLRNRQAALDSRQRKKSHTEKLELEKKEFISKEAELTHQLNQQMMNMAQEREEWMHQREEYEGYIQNLMMEREENIRSSTLETAELRRQNNFLKEMIQDMQRQMARSRMPPSAESFDSASHNFGTLEMEENWEDSEYGFISRDDMKAEGDDPFYRQATPRPTSAPAAVEVEATDTKANTGFSWNTFCMCLLYGAFTAANSGTKPESGVVSTTLLPPTIPAFSEHYRTEAGNVLKAVLGSAPTNGEGAVDDSGFSMNMIGEFNDNIIGQGPSGINALHASLTTPTRHQQQVAAFGLSASSYNHLMDPEEVYDIDAGAEDFIDPKPTRLEEMYASMQAERDNIDKITGLGGRARERSVLLGSVPEKVLREFKALVGMTEQMNIQ